MHFIETIVVTITINNNVVERGKIRLELQLYSKLNITVSEIRLVNNICAVLSGGT